MIGPQGTTWSSYLIRVNSRICMEPSMKRHFLLFLLNLSQKWLGLELLQPFSFYEKRRHQRMQLKQRKGSWRLNEWRWNFDTSGANFHLSLDMLVIAPNNVPFAVRPVHSRFSNKQREVLSTQSEIKWHFLMRNFSHVPQFHETAMQFGHWEIKRFLRMSRQKYTAYNHKGMTLDLDVHWSDPT